MKLLRPDLFDLNPHREIHSERIGEGRHHLVVIDDLFQYPRDISALMNELPYSDHLDIREAAPTFRCSMRFPNIGSIYQELITEHSDINAMEQSVPGFDLYWDQSHIIDLKSCPPHVDVTMGSSYALVIYMNENHLHGGTQFIRHTTNGKEISSGADEVFQQDTTIRKDTPWGYEPLEWQRYHLVPMKFNRLVSYRNNLLHSMYTNGSFYRDHPRKTIVSNF